MSPKHHPSDDILASYAAGALEPGFGLVVGAHLEGCPACRAKAAGLEAASGAALKDLPPAEIGADALARVLVRMDEVEPETRSRDPRPLLERLPLQAKKWVAPGVWAAPVDTPHAPNNRVYLLRIAAGMPAARHEHTGVEFCTVLKGAYRDELGLFAAGDFAVAEGDFNHQPKVEPGEECICLFATEGRLKPQGLIGRIAFALADV